MDDASATPDRSPTTEERFLTLAEVVGARAGADPRVGLDRREVVVRGRTLVVERFDGLGSVWVLEDGEEVELPLLDVDGFARTWATARWRGQWLSSIRPLDPGHVLARYQGDPTLARERGLYGDVRDGWSGTFPIPEAEDVTVRRRAYDVPAMLASTTRPRTLDETLRAAGHRPEAVDWITDDGGHEPRDGRWTIRATRAGFVVGASGRGVFSTYDVFPTGAPAIALAVRLVAEPLRRVDRTTPEQGEAGRRTGAAILERTTARGGGTGPAALAVGDLVDCLGPESGHHLYALGTMFSWRSQPPSDVGAGRYAFRIARPLPPEVREGVAVPWFGQQGGGAMVVLDRPIRWYVDHGHLEPVGEPMAKELSDFLDVLDGLPGWSGVSYRGLPPGPLPPVGTVIRTTTLTATSRSPRVATENFTVGGLWAINGRSGRALEKVYDASVTRDVVLRPGSFLRVVKVARVGDLPVVLLEDEAFWEPRPPAHATLDDFAAEVGGRVVAARTWDDVPVTEPGKFAGPIR